MILIVDDYQDGADALCRLLTRQGYTCSHAPSGPEALAAIRAHPPEMPLLVLLDNMMPGMTGLDTLREIRNDQKIAGTTVIFFTAGFDVANRDEAMTLGAVAWMLKGGTGGGIDEVIRSIGHWYERVGGVKSAQRPGA